MINFVSDEYHYIISCSKKAGSTTVRTLCMAIHIQEIIKKLVNDEQTNEKIKEEKTTPGNDYMSVASMITPYQIQYCPSICPPFDEIMKKEYNDYKKIMIIHDPYKRFISGFIHLVLVKREGIPLQKIERKYGLNFKGFIRYISHIFNHYESCIKKMDIFSCKAFLHFERQISANRLSYIKKQYHLIRLDNLNDELPKIYSQVLKITLPTEILTSYNNTIYSDKYDSMGLDIPNMSIYKLSELGLKYRGFPKYHHFKCPELTTLIEKYYSIDLDVYNHVNEYQKFTLS